MGIIDPKLVSLRLRGIRSLLVLLRKSNRNRQRCDEEKEENGRRERRVKRGRSQPAALRQTSYQYHFPKKAFCFQERCLTYICTSDYVTHPWTPLKMTAQRENTPPSFSKTPNPPARLAGDSTDDSENTKNPHSHAALFGPILPGDSRSCTF